MAAKMTFLIKFKAFLQDFSNILTRYGRNQQHPGMFGAPALCYDTGAMTQPSAHSASTSQSILADIFNPVLYAVPRNRRSLERRKIRKMSEFLFKNARPKKNIVVCLNCGHHHEIQTICGNCYDKVRKETKVMREAMGDDKYNYDHPRTEVAYLYKGETVEDIPKYKGRYLVEVDKERPSWFPAHLMKKTKGES